MANTLEIVIKATDKASKEIGSVAKGVQGLGGVASAAMKGIAIAGSAAVTAVGAVGAAIGKLAVDAIPLQGIEAAFEGISGASDEMLDALRRGSLGMVTDRELMRNYNQAVQLVSKTFADQLPDAMKYLAKVSAATGQDMGYMLDSLTKGVGRLSPMILDNLGIQVSLEEATAEAAEMFGVEADALSKTQLQAGMMNVVMRALERNTADMPEIAGTAAQRWAALGTTFKNVKDQIGLAFSPVLERGMGAVEMFVNDKLPGILTWFTDKFAPGVGEAIDRAAQFVKNLASGERFNVAIRELLAGVLAPEDIEKIVDVSRWVEGFTNAITAGDWSKAGGMIWEQITTAASKVTAWGGDILDGLREGMAGGLGIDSYFWEDGFLKQGDTSWKAIGQEILKRIVDGMLDLSDVLLGFTAKIKEKFESSGESEDAMATGVMIGEWIVDGLKGLFDTDDTQGQTVLQALLANLKRAALNLHDAYTARGADIATGIITGMTERIESDEEVGRIREAMRRAISRSNPIGAILEGWREAQDWVTGRELGPLGQRLDALLPFSGRATGGFASGLTLVGERGPEIVSLPRGSYVHDNRESERMMGGTSVTFGPGAIVIQGNATRQEVEIGVLRGLRAAGVGIR